MIQDTRAGQTLALAGEMADTARGIALDYFRTTLPYESKQDGSPVTLADKTIEARLRALIEGTFPEDGIVGEEQDSVRIDSPRLWIVDPIDGTKSFMTGMPTFGCLIATYEDGAPDLGVIELPALNERFVGKTGRATEFNGTPCHTRACTRLAEAIVYATSPDIFTEAELAAFDRVSKQAAIRRFGGDCYAYALLASGHVDLVIESELKPFDYLALVPVVQGAGGVITDWTGQPLTLESDGRVIAAATPELHAEALAALAL
ncbi:histidinol-phosphatase [Pseudooceanicola sp. CBS1P-1]|uniref:Histidinol-phosphatase n=1 Tax=Pseudooceanicola albus TaxID=2692189 RepID=A0A6L7G619_9RHOB|nr:MULTISPECIES: histidinol-phosphatase [Pseudooceanicola]MBT9385305.1 histidinol-phosphatase [Pseudooceanicola endophyticus]MXN18836.1 histidinol-phosphatase [Pseudooceanicola albus]